MDLHPYLFCLSFYLLYFVLPLFEDNGLPSGCLMSSATIQKLFCRLCSVFKCSFNEFVGGEGGLPVLFLHHLRTASWRLLNKLPYNPTIPLLGIYSEKTKIQKTHVLQCSLRHCLQKLSHGSNLDVH